MIILNENSCEGQIQELLKHVFLVDFLLSVLQFDTQLNFASKTLRDFYGSMTGQTYFLSSSKAM